jgi:hypothetical protein
LAAQGFLWTPSRQFTHLNGMLDYSCTITFKWYCVGALNGWQTIWEEMISDHGNQSIRKLRKDTPSDNYAL